MELSEEARARFATARAALARGEDAVHLLEECACEAAAVGDLGLAVVAHAALARHSSTRAAVAHLREALRHSESISSLAVAGSAEQAVLASTAAQLRKELLWAEVGDPSRRRSEEQLTAFRTTDGPPAGWEPLRLVPVLVERTRQSRALSSSSS